ncbi:MAG TPA: DUF4097 family beta strand repeat-containing protein [Longimicrobiales bacterium]|nr:DUF4097 family beta strand repeat-containing protein [Longimicrobiales bacterium]
MSATLLIGVLAAALAQQQQPQTDTTFAVRAGSRIEVETFGGEINVKTWDKNAVRVQAVHGRRDVIDIDSRGSAVHIEAEGRMGVPTNVDFTITVPASVSLGLSGVYTDIVVDGVTGDIDAETVSGAIKVTGGSRVKVESVEGAIVIDHVRGRINANTVNRGIRISNSIGDIEAETVNGPIILTGVQATTVDLATVNGRVVYDGTIRDNGDYAIASHNGPIYVVIPEKAGLSVSVSTFNGDLEASFPISVGNVSAKKRFNFTIGSGSARLDLETFGGDIHLRRPGEAIPTTMEESKTRVKVKVKTNKEDNE